jgi:TonB family protein
MKDIFRPSIPFLILAFMVVPQFSISSPPPAPPDLGTWWRDSDVVRGLQLRDTQIRQIEQAFLSHRSELGTLAEQLQREEHALRSIIDTRSLDEKRATAQIDQVVNARARLEKEKTLMALDIRRAVSLDQWRMLQEMQRSQAGDSSASEPPPIAARADSKADAAAPEAEEPVYQIGGPVSAPVPIQRPAPGFTPEAKARRLAGNVLLSVVIGKDGAVRNVRVLRGLGYGLDESAVETVTSKWFFKPSTLNGRPVSVQANIEVTFGMVR